MAILSAGGRGGDKGILALPETRLPSSSLCVLFFLRLGYTHGWGGKLGAE